MSIKTNYLQKTETPKLGTGLEYCRKRRIGRFVYNELTNNSNIKLKPSKTSGFTNGFNLGNTVFLKPQPKRLYSYNLHQAQTQQSKNLTNQSSGGKNVDNAEKRASYGEKPSKLLLFNEGESTRWQISRTPDTQPEEKPQKTYVWHLFDSFIA